MVEIELDVKALSQDLSTVCQHVVKQLKVLFPQSVIKLGVLLLEFEAQDVDDFE